jgi:8-oxo-dGTP pyrophosphatase MutT (NUDIX family)
MNLDFIINLEQALKSPLPGRKAQVKMAPGQGELYYEVPDSHNVACVLALLFPRNSEWHIAFIERNSHKNDKHSGQISFPGGKMEVSDSSHSFCALRETEEEIGIDKSDIKILAKLTELFVFVSKYNVHPFVGDCEVEPNFVPQASEVKKIIEVPVTHFTSGEYLSRKDIHVRNIVIKDVPFYKLNGHVLWGATAMMMSELTEIMRSIQGT